MTEQIGLEAILEDTSFTKGLNNMLKGMVKAEKQTKKTAGIWSKSFNKMGSGVLSFGKTATKALMFGAASVVAGLAAVGVGIAKLTIDAAELPTITDAFEGIAESSGKSSNAVLSALQEQSMGMITNAELMKSYNSAAQLVGTTFANQLPDAMGFLGKVAAATGEDMGFMMSSLVKGVGRMSPMILDNLGIQVSLTEANKAYADQMGINVEEMTKSEQQAALMNQVLEKLAENTAAMPDITESAATKMAAFKVSMQNAGLEIGAAFVPAMTVLMDTVGGFVHNIAPLVIAWAEKAGEWLAVNLPLAIQTLTEIWTGTLLPALTTFWEFVQANIFPVLQELYNWLSVNLPVAIQFITDHWVEFKGAIIGVAAVLAGAGILTAITTIIAALNPVTLVIGAIIAAAALLGAAWAGNWGDIQGKTKAVVDFILPLIQNFLASIEQWWDDHGDQVISIVNAIWEGIKATFEALSTVIKPIFDAFASAFQGDWESFGESLREAWEAAWVLIQEVFVAAVEAIKAIPWKQIGMDIINGIKAGVIAAGESLIKAITEVIDAAKDAAKGFFGIESPSKVFAKEIGEPIVQGIALGITESGHLIEDALSDVFEPTGKNIRGADGSRLPRHIGRIIGEKLAEGIIEGIRSAQNIPLDDILAAGGTLSGIAGGFAKLYTKKEIDPLLDLKEGIEEQIDELKDLETSTDLDEYNRLEQLVALERERVRIAEELAEKKKRVRDLEKQQADLAFLQQQMGLLDFIKEQGLDPSEILSGMTLGLDASLPALIDAMNIAMKAVIEAANEELGIASPSSVAIGWAENIMGSFAGAIASMAGLPAMSMGQSMAGAVSTASAVSAAPLASSTSTRTANFNFGDTNLASGMDASVMENMVKRVVRSELGVAS